MTKTALITGITGQDGSYLAELLLEKGYEVHGLVRRASTFGTTRIDHLYLDPHQEGARLFLHYGDLTDGNSLSRLLYEVLPDEVYNLGAQSHVAVSFANPLYTADVDALGTLRVLEVIRQLEHPIRFYANAAMGLNVIEESRRRGVSKFVQAGTVCAYPKFAASRFGEDDLWNGYPEETNAPYGIAKKALLVMLQGYRQLYGFNGIYLLPVNLYGPGDNFDLESSHVIPALIRKFVTARDRRLPSVGLWGTGAASREFLFVDDAARAIVMATESYDRPDPVNVGTAREITIRELATLIASLTGYEGSIDWDPERPDGQPRRMLDTSRAKEFFGFEVDLEDGLRRTIDWWERSGDNGFTE